MSRTADTALGVGAVALAGAYAAMASAIPISMLSDAVGPGGVPMVIAGMIGLAGAALLLRTALIGGGRAAAQPDHVRAAGLLVLLVLYVLALPLLGYPLALALLVAGVAMFAGARGWAVAAFAVALAGAFWFAFVKLLGIPFPTGTLWGGY